MIPLNRFATSRLRLLLVVVLGSVVSGGAWRLYGEYRRPLRAAASEFLSMRRVLRHVDEIEFAARESGVDPYLLAGIMVAESSGRVDAVS
ncbi:MAG TPA: hypothetical protein ENJ09_05890, partial [Planctomycetes bacterium]|nr:hypothetical protein [Planctomycetota bacterium]